MPSRTKIASMSQAAMRSAVRPAFDENALVVILSPRRRNVVVSEDFSSHGVPQPRDSRRQ